MKTYVNDIGCSLSFDEGIDEEVINARLEMFGDNWRELK